MKLTAFVCTALLLGTATQSPFRSGVELIEIPVIVRDRDARFVADLKKDDFQVTEQGVPQDITAFSRVSIPVRGAGSGTNSAAVAVPRDVSTNLHLSEARVFVIVLDVVHVASQRSEAVRTLARQFIEQHVGAADLVAVVSPGGLASATQDFTNDATRLLAAVDRFAGSKLRSAAVELEEEKRAAERGGVALHGGKDPSDHERANRAYALTNALEVLARHLERVQGRRKALLLFSEGIDYDTTDVTGAVQQNANEVMRAMHRSIGALMRANVSVYAMDPRRLTSVEGELLEAPLYRATPSVVTGPSPEAELATSLRALHDVSDSTGGFAAVDRNDFSGAFARIIEESSNYYVLGYTPAKAPKPGEFRQIAVRVSRPDVQVVARKGYGVSAAAREVAVAGPDPFLEPTQPGIFRPPPRRRVMDSAPSDIPINSGARNPPTGDVRTLLASPLPLAGLPMRVQAIPFIANRDKTAVHVVIEVLGGTLQFGQRGGRFEERIDLASVTVNARGKADNGRATTLNLRLTPEELYRVRASGVRWLSKLDLTPGRHQLRVAGHAERTGTTGLVMIDVDVPKFEPARPALSGVTITSTTSVLMITKGDAPPSAALATPPSAARTFVAGDRLTARVDVYVPAVRTPRMDLTAHLESAEGSKSIAFEKKIANGQKEPRSEEIAFDIDTTTLRPGSYVLRLAISSSAGTRDRIERAVAFELVSAQSTGR